MTEYFPKLKSLGANEKVELDLSNYPTKADLKNAKVLCLQLEIKGVYNSKLKPFYTAFLHSIKDSG